MSRRTVVMAAGTLLSRVTGFGRIVALGYVAGTSALTDTYNLANTTPNIVYELVVGGILSATLVPVFVSSLSGARPPAQVADVDRAEEAPSDPSGGLEQQRQDDGWLAVSAVVTTMAAVLVVLSVAFALLAPALVGLYTGGGQAIGSDGQELAVTLVRFFAPQVALYGVVSIGTALLNARRLFATPMFAPVLNNLTVTAMFLLLPTVVDRVTVAQVRASFGAQLLLGVGTTAGVALLALPLVVSAVRAGLLGRTRLRPVWSPLHPAVRQVVRLSGWTVGFVVANQVALWVVLSLATRGNEGDLSAYQYAYIFFLLPHGVIAVSVMTALLPDLSEHWSRGDLASYRHDVGLGVRTIGAALVPAAVGYVLLAGPIVTLVLQHGRLTSEAAETIAEVLVAFALGLPAFSAFLLLTRAFNAMADTRSVFVLYAIENGVNIALALLLHAALGVQGLALSYALAYWVGAGVALWRLRRRVAGVEGRAIARSLARTTAATAVMGVAVALVARTVGSGDAGEPVVQVLAAVLTGIVVYLVACRLFGVTELLALVQGGRRRGR